MRKTSLALACASLGLVGTVHAASSASASVGGLTFQVIDLNPFDGVDAAFSFVATAVGSTNLQVSATDNGESDSASKSRSQAFYTKTLSTEDLANATATASVAQYAVSATGSATGINTSFNAQAGTSSGYYYGSSGILSLSANSLLIVSAEASVSAKATHADCGYYYCGSNDWANSSASFSLNYSYASGPINTSYNFNDSVSTSASAYAGYYNYVYNPETGWYDSVYVNGSDADNSVNRTFTAVFTNSSATTQFAGLSMSANVYGYGSSAFPQLLSAPTAAVPEASAITMALAGLGMGGLIYRRRRTV